VKAKDIGAEIERAAMSLVELAGRLRAMQLEQQAEASTSRNVVHELVDKLARQTRQFGEQQRALTVSKFAKAHDVSPSTIWRLLKRGELRSVRIGHRVLIPLDQTLPSEVAS
jgi:excisionase family DNA binding protein